MEIDNFDLKILNQLEKDATQSYYKIGKEINRSKQFVYNRILNLQKKKIIQEYILDADLRKLGYALFNVFLQFQNIDQKKESAINSYLKRSKYVGYCFKTIGNWDCFISVRSKDIQEFYKFLGDFHKFCKGLIKKEIINFEIMGIDTNLKFLSFSNISSNIGFNNMTDLEKNIFEKLREKPLMSNLELAEEFNKSYETIKKIVNKLKEDKIIKCIRAKIDTEKLGYNRYLFLIELNYLSNEKLKEILRHLESNKNIRFIMQCIGGWNLVCNVYSKDIYEITRIINDLRGKFGTAIFSIEFLRILESDKELFNF